MFWLSGTREDVAFGDNRLGEVRFLSGFLFRNICIFVATEYWRVVWYIKLIIINDD